MKHEFYVDSSTLFDTVTMFHEPREFWLRTTVGRMRDSFESGKLNAMN